MTTKTTANITASGRPVLVVSRRRRSLPYVSAGTAVFDNTGLFTRVRARDHTRGRSTHVIIDRGGGFLLWPKVDTRHR